MSATACYGCDGSGWAGRRGVLQALYKCPQCGGDGKQPTHKQIQDYAWRKADRDYPRAVTVADAMRRFKCEKEKIFKVVGFLHGEEGSETHPKGGLYFFIIGAPDEPPEKLTFDFDGA